MTRLVLDCFFQPADTLEEARLEFTLTNTGSTTLKSFSLAYTALTRAGRDARLENAENLNRIANFHEITPADKNELSPGESWSFAIIGLANPARHRLDGPKSGYVTAGGQILEVTCNDLQAPVDLDSGERRHIPDGKISVPLSIVPWPQSVSVSSCSDDLIAYQVVATGADDIAAASKINALAKRLFPQSPHPFRFASSNRLQALAMEQDPELASDAYRLTFLDGTTSLAYGGTAGRDYGLTVLAQIVHGAYTEPGLYKLPLSGEIEDQPRFSWRGTHLDVSRHFRGPKDILRLLDLLAWARMNKFQWHLTDDEGWRLEIKSYPELTVSGARRGPGCRQVAQLGFASQVYQGYYTQDDVRDIVTHAASLNIDVLPEIDVPGHSTAVLKTYSYLEDQAEPPESYHSIQGYPNNALNPAMEETYAFLEKVFGEVADLFPCEFVHIGGDEVDTQSWLQSPKAQRLMQELDLKDAMELQAHFMGRVRDILKRHGKKLAGWDEVSHGGGIDPDGVLLMAWQTQQVTRDLIAQGYDVVCTPGQKYYMDMAQASGWYEPGASWAGVSTPRDAYEFEATTGLNEGGMQQLKGVQACIWCEHMTHNDIFNYMVFPRLYAVAEAGWTNPDQKSWQRFAALTNLFPEL